MKSSISENTPLANAPEAGESPIRFVTATSLFDGHDASINIIRRTLQRAGAEVIHLGHNRPVHEVVTAALQEDAHAIAVSSYQGGHNEYFQYMIDLLKEAGASHIRVFGGGGGVIVASEIKALMNYGVECIYSPDDGRSLGLDGMAHDMIARVRNYKGTITTPYRASLSYQISQIEMHTVVGAQDFVPPRYSVPILGFTGSGGAGKSSLIDEFLRRFKLLYPQLKLALLSVDPTQRKTGGALLGDRLRLNSVNDGEIFMRSLATRTDNAAISPTLKNILAYLRGVTSPATNKSEFDLIVIESAGIGQSDTSIADLVDFSVYVMTPEYGAATQLEKIAMLDYADMVLINKSDRVRAEDALIQVRKQFKRNRRVGIIEPERVPVYPTIANRFGDQSVDAAFAALIQHLQEKKLLPQELKPALQIESATIKDDFIPAKRSRYLSEISDAVRAYHEHAAEQAELVGKVQALYTALSVLGFSAGTLGEPIKTESTEPFQSLIHEYNNLLARVNPPLLKELHSIETTRNNYAQETYSYKVRDKDVTVRAGVRTLSGTLTAKVVPAPYKDWRALAEFLQNENIPGEFPFTAGVFPFKREGEDPTRMFAGEGSPERTNRRFHLIAKGQDAKRSTAQEVPGRAGTRGASVARSTAQDVPGRAGTGGASVARLSTAFDSITLYGENPAERPDIFGKIGNAGVSICTVDDMKKLYSGFDLSAPTTSVSMTINGPAPTILAFFLNAAIDQQVEAYLAREGKLAAAQEAICNNYDKKGLKPPQYADGKPDSHDGLGLALMGASGEEFVAPEIYANLRQATLMQVRGTVQADILKEDQAQNTCIFSTEFSLKTMGDVQEFFIENKVANFYSVSVSGYHIAEAGANPITQVAFTLANGFTLAEYYLSRGMKIDDFARNFSFFFSNGMDVEYAVIGRVARRIWAIAMRDLYSADARAQKLKYHIQTSGRSLHAQEISFNDIRTTLQALYAIMDNCNSLHTNAYDEAVTTPTPESVRRAIAIQLIINRELGLTKNENPLQGSYFVTRLTDLVEEAILQEFDRISERGGVLGAMETMYQRHKIQEESLYYERLKTSGELPIIGVNTYLGDEAEYYHGELMRSSNDEKKRQILALENFHAYHADKSAAALGRLRKVALKSGNVFAELMETVKTCSLGQITHTLYEVGGSYRRNM
ncbi:MAG: methylmalonyl-CoA mutase family protein [Spirochaetes bacterium]|nr:methylmalonyl-CoA mutase family protein [Spirochaetota bacterium]